MEHDQKFRELFRLDALDDFNQLDREEYERNEMHGRSLIVWRVIDRIEEWPAYVATVAPSDTLPMPLPKLPFPDWVREEFAKWAKAVRHLASGRNPLDEPSRDDVAAWQRWHDTENAFSFSQAPQIMLAVMGLGGRQGVGAWGNYDKDQHRQAKASVARILRNGGVPKGKVKELIAKYLRKNDPSKISEIFRAASEAAAEAKKPPGKP